MKSIARTSAFGLLFGALLALCAPFLQSPLFFDDLYAFRAGALESMNAQGVQFAPRAWVFETFALTSEVFNDALLWMRFGNLFAHACVSFVLYLFVRRLLHDLDNAPDKLLGKDAAAILSAAFFAIHPLAIYTQAYLVQRTIICATLFALLSLYSFWRGLGGSRASLWLSLPLFLVSIMAKEHVVMMPFVAVLLWVLYKRSAVVQNQSASEVAIVLFLQLTLSVLVTLGFKLSLLANPYEQMTGEMLQGELDLPQEMLYPLSFLNQAGLFFKYLGLWLLPNPAWLSVDMREAFPLGFGDPMLWLGPLVFVGYMLGGGLLLWRGGAVGLLGLAVLIPGVLFATEFSTVRLQECFVLYRSYLWMPGVFIALSLGLRRLSRMLVLLVPVMMLFFVALSFDRLSVLSRPHLVWLEARDLLERSGEGPGVLGGYRIYYNVGVTLYEIGRSEEALENYNQALARNPTYTMAYLNRGIIFLNQKNWSAALADFDKAIELVPVFFKAYLGKAQALEGDGRADEARQVLQQACDLGAGAICEKLQAQK